MLRKHAPIHMAHPWNILSKPFPFVFQFNRSADLDTGAILANCSLSSVLSIGMIFRAAMILTFP